MNNLLVVVDMVNGFINFGNLSDKKINKITPFVEKLIQKAIKNGDKIVAFCDCHVENDEEFKIYPVHCLKGSKESELIDELKPYEKNMQIIEKQTTDGFKSQEFQKLIENNNFDNITVCGCCTDICVQDFSMSLNKYFVENNIKTKIMVISDAVYTFDAPNHIADVCQEKSLNEMKKAGIIVV